MKEIIVIGAGFGGISAAAYLAQAGYDVTVYEKNHWVGGRARVLERDGFRLDMGPSWYWMPDEHDRWFSDMGLARADFYSVHRVDPSYKVYFGSSTPDEKRNEVVIPADFAGAMALFESYERGAAEKLERFVEQARQKYELAMGSFIYRNFNSPLDMVNRRLLGNLFRLNFFTSCRGMIERYFSHPYLKKILEFPAVFLGSHAARTPAIYTLMNYIDFGLGTWYPEGGFGRVVDAMREVAESKGAKFVFDSEVASIRSTGGRAVGIVVRSGTGEKEIQADAIVANADYVHVENSLLEPASRSLDRHKWAARTLGPAVLSFYLGFNRKLTSFTHHTFFFDTDWDAHFDAVYRDRQWPEKPLFYLHIPSMTDPRCAPPEHEAMTILIPCAPGLDDNNDLREHYFELAMNRMEKLTGESLRDAIVFRESMSVTDFRRDYNAHDGTAFGLGQTLSQTAYFRPPNRSKRLSNLYYAGHYTVPGTGTTMSMISGKLAAMRIKEEWPLA